MFFQLICRLLFLLSIIIALTISIPALYFTYITFKASPEVTLDSVHELPGDYVKLDSIVRQKNISLSTGVTLHVYEAGDPKNPLIVFIHGFPENGLVSWKYQIPFFVEKGYFVVAPDNRGYGRSQAPEFDDFMVCNHEEAGKDINALILHYDKKKPIVVGHDWGAGAVFDFAAEFPTVAEKVVILNMMHPQLLSVYPSRMLSMQLIKSWYIFYNQLTGIAEDWWTKNDFAIMINAMITNAHTREDARRLKNDWSIPSNIVGMLNWYRYTIRYRLFNKKEVKPITVPLLMLFGKSDQAIEWYNGELSTKLPFATNGRFEPYEGISHWIQHEAPDRVNEDILKFIQ
jgi:pimeloyl-ACP methyl ester carboxylesterase